MDYIYDLFITMLGILPFYLSIVILLLKPLKKYQYLVLFGYCFILSAFFYTALGQSITIFNITGCLVFIILFQRDRKLINTICSLIGYITAVILDYIILFLLDLFNISVEKINEYHPVLFSTLFSVLILFTLLLLRHIAIKLNLETLIYRIKRTSRLILFNVSFLTLIIIFNISIGDIIGYSSFVITFNCIIFFIFFAISTYLSLSMLKTINNEHSLKAELEQYATLDEYTQHIEKLNEELRLFRHDYCNILSSIGTYIHENDMKGLEQYFSLNIVPYSDDIQKDEHALGRLSFIKDKYLKSIIYAKIIYALNHNINVTVDIVETINITSINPIDITRIIGILLDNAVEGALTSNSPKLQIAFIKKEQSVTIIIENSCDDIPFDINDIYKINVSSKGEGHGLGLHNIHMILQKYNNVIHTTSYENNIFSQQLEIINYTEANLND